MNKMYLFGASLAVALAATGAQAQTAPHPACPNQQAAEGSSMASQKAGDAGVTASAQQAADGGVTASQKAADAGVTASAQKAGDGGVTASQKAADAGVTASAQKAADGGATASQKAADGSAMQAQKVGEGANIPCKG
jgi:hypothetical protein